MPHQHAAAAEDKPHGPNIEGSSFEGDARHPHDLAHGLPLTRHAAPT